MTTANFAVQPASYQTFDEWGCTWALNLENAYELANKFAPMEGDQVIWRCPHQGEPIAWVTVGSSVESTVDAIASLLFD